MSSVTPSDGYSSYYMKHLTELEDEIKRDGARAEQRAREHTQDLEKRYAEALRANDEKTNAAVDQIREDARESVRRSKENDRAEIDRIRKQNYDKFGRDRTNEADALRAALNSSIRANQKEHEGYQTRLRETEAAQASRTEALRRDYADRIENAVQTAHDSAHKSYHDAYQAGSNMVEEQKREAAQKYAELNDERMAEAQHQRRLNEKLADTFARDMANAKEHSEKAFEARLRKGLEASQARTDEVARRSQDTLDKETRALRETIDHLSAGDTYQKEKGQGARDAIREYEDGWRAREQMTERNHASEVAQLKKLAEEADAKRTASHGANMRERDAQFAKLLSKGAAEAREEKKDMAQRYEVGQAALEQRIKKDGERSQALLESSLREANEARAADLEKQAAAYQATMKNQRQADREEVKALERQLRIQNAPEDSSTVPPAVEASVRKSVVREYEKTLASDNDRNKRLVDSLQRSFKDRFEVAQLEHQAAVSQREHQNRVERQEEQTRFLDHMHDSETVKEQTLRLREYEHERETANIHRNYTQAAVRMRNEYEGMLQATRDDAASRITALRQEHEFESKTAHRAFTLKQNELVRTYEKKLADQKADNDARMEELKNQHQIALRESERRGKAAMEDQARGYEMRLTQLQNQLKERERIVSQNYEEELDKIRRSNALQKKS